MVDSKQLEQVQTEAEKAKAAPASIAAGGYSALTPEQRAAVNKSLGYFDYLQDVSPDADEATRQKELEEAYRKYMADSGWQNLTPIEQFLALIISFLSGNGIDVSAFKSLLPPEVFNQATGNGRWEKSHGPIAGQPIEFPDHVIPVGLGTEKVPSADTAIGKEGRYRLMAVPTGEKNNGVNSEMVVVDPDGKVVWSGLMHSGSGNKVPLPGLQHTLNGKSVTTEYAIDWNDVRMGRTDPIGKGGMCYSDGSAGFSFTLVNPDNLAAIGGAGRGEFRIHPGGHGVGTSGCQEFLDSKGQISAESDAQARSFAKLMNSLPADKRPTGLEILNPKMLVAKEQAKEIPVPTKSEAAPSAPRALPDEKTTATTTVDVSKMPKLTCADVSEHGAAPSFKAANQAAPVKAAAAI